MAISLPTMPQRVFLDSSTLQTLRDYGAFIYENELVAPRDRIRRNPRGLAHLEALRQIMRIAERAPFEFALSENSLQEVYASNDPGYIRWAYDVLDHWQAYLEESDCRLGDPTQAALLESTSYGYLGTGDRRLLHDALVLGCDSFMTMESRLPKNPRHLQATLGIRVLSPSDAWDLICPWAALFQ
jgi:hypothetical protein